MDVNAIGMPTNRPVMDQSSTPAPEAVSAKSNDLAKVNTAKSSLPEGVGAKVDKTA